jgi:hypothetical protein
VRARPPKGRTVQLLLDSTAAILRTMRPTL